MKQLQFKTGLDQSPFFYIAAAGVFILPLIFSIYAGSAYETPKIVTYYILSAASLVALTYYAQKRKVLWHKKAVLSWLAFVSIYFILSFLARDPYLAFFGTRYIETALFFLASVPLLLGFLQVSKEEWKRISWILPIQSLFVSLLALAQTFFKVATYDYLKLVLIRATSTLGSAAVMVYYLNIAFLITLYFFMEERRTKVRIFLGTVLFINLWAIVMSGARAGWIALFGALFILLLNVLKDKQKRAIAAVILGLFILLFGLFVNLSRSDRMQNIFSSSDFNVFSRVSVWQLSLDLIKQNPLIGIGPNNFILSYQENKPEELLGYKGYFDQAHNFILQILLNVGMLGFIPFTLFFWYVLRRSFSIIRNYSFELVVLLGLGTVLVHALLQPLDITSWFFILLLSAILLGRDSEEVKIVNNTKLFLPVFYLVAAAGFTAILMWSVADQYAFWGKVAYARFDYSTAISRFEKAITLNPYNPDYYFHKAASNAYATNAYDPDLEKIEKLQPDFGRGLVRMANVQLYVGYGDETLRQKGLDTLGRAMEKDRDNYQLLTTYAGWKLAYNQIDGVEETLLKAYDLNPEDPLVLQFLASYYERTAQFEKRQEALQKLYLLDPLNMQLKHFLEFHKNNDERLPFSARFTPGIIAW